MIDFRAITQGIGLEASADLDGETLVVTFSGAAEMVAAAPLVTICERLHATALEHRVTQVRVDLTRLEFMSSSCFKSLLTWIGQIRDLGPADQYTLVLSSSTAHLWQRRSLHVLEGFAPNLVRIETGQPGG